VEAAGGIDRRTHRAERIDHLDHAVKTGLTLQNRSNKFETDCAGAAHRTIGHDLPLTGWAPVHAGMHRLTDQAAQFERRTALGEMLREKDLKFRSKSKLGERGLHLACS
jgi:hypothetical protein